MKTYIRTFLFLALAYLLTPTLASAETLYACKLNGIGTVRMVSATANCSQLETKISWNSTGPQGPMGVPGLQGIQGSPGPIGATGAAGAPGQPGQQGIAGPVGGTGETGAQGLTGLIGEKGDTGLQGLKGDKGDKGDPGSGGGLICTTAPNVYLVTAANGTQTCQARYVDNGDGTVTDNQTGLMWEKKTSACVGEVTCLNNIYTWTDSVTAADGSLYTNFLATLNQDASSGGNSTCFANHCDWRIPNIAELQGILLTPFPCSTSPCIDSIFGPTQAFFYWSSSSLAGHPDHAWAVNFFDGSVSGIGKRNFAPYAHAVRGGR